MDLEPPGCTVSEAVEVGKAHLELPALVGRLTAFDLNRQSGRYGTLPVPG